LSGSTFTGAKAERNSADVRAALGRVKKAAQGGENLMPCLVEAVKTYATLGEIMGELKDVFGEYREPRSF
jgi:methylmalonyl-CoA mutase N-terminal domain/subunit